MPNSPASVGFNLPFDEAIAAMEARGVVLPEKYYGELQGIHRQLNFSIAGVASLDQLQGVLDSLTAKLADGQSFKQWQDSVAVQDLGLPKHRLDNIFRTNIQNAYNRGHWEQFKENEKFAPYLMYDAINDSRTRPSHRALNGIIRLASDPFWDTHYPANGYRCRCSVVSLSEKQAQARSKGGNGLNKSIDVEKMKPDKGWDYNCGEDLTAGIDRAVVDRKANPDIDAKLKAGLIANLAVSAKVVESQAEKQIAEKMPVVNKKEFADYVEKVTAEDYKARHEFVRVGSLPNFVMVDNAVTELNPINNEIHVSDYQLKHAQRNQKSAPLNIDDVKKLPDKLENARWFYDSNLNNLTAVFDIESIKDVGKAIVVINFSRSKKEIYNAIKTSGVIDILTLNMKNYREIKDEP